MVGIEGQTRPLLQNGWGWKVAGEQAMCQQAGNKPHPLAGRVARAAKLMSAGAAKQTPPSSTHATGVPGKATSAMQSRPSSLATEPCMIPGTDCAGVIIIKEGGGCPTHLLLQLRIATGEGVAAVASKVAVCLGPELGRAQPGNQALQLPHPPGLQPQLGLQRLGCTAMAYNICFSSDPGGGLVRNCTTVSAHFAHVWGV